MKTLPLKIPVHQHLQRHFQHWLHVLGYSPSVVHYLPCYLQEFLYYLEQHNLAVIRGELPVSAYVDHLKQRKKVRQQGSLSNHSINNQIYMLSKFSEYLFRVHGQILPVTVRPLEVPGQPDYVFSRADIEALYAATEETPAGSRDRAMLSICYGCGLRRTEGERLNVEDIKSDAVWVRESKNGKGRMVPVSSGVKEHLREYLLQGRRLLSAETTEPAFFLNRKGHRISGGSLYVRLKKLLITSGLSEQYPRAGLHTLRHSIATHLMDSGMRIEDISRFLGHRSLESTRIYTHLSTGTIQ